jgi:polysaccharide export outer membrane protein
MKTELSHYPALGILPVSGLTRVEATKKIEELYRKELLKDPIIRS